MCQKMHKRSSWIKLLRKVSPWSRKHQKGIELFIAPTYFIHLHASETKVWCHFDMQFPEHVIEDDSWIH
jgi:hypothetical protein